VKDLRSLRVVAHLALALVLLLALGAEARAQRQVRIGFVLDGPSPENETLLAMFQSELTHLLQSEFDIQFPVEGTRTADFTTAGVRAANSESLEDPAVDLLITLGMIASLDACQRETLAKPVFAPLVGDAEILDIPQVDGASGIRNLSYLVFPRPFRRFAIRGTLQARHCRARGNRPIRAPGDHCSTLLVREPTACSRESR